MIAGIGIKEVYLKDSRDDIIARAIYRLLQDINEKKILTVPVNDYQTFSKDGTIYFNFEFKD